MTPEGITKKRVKAILAEYDALYSHWPVLNGMGAPEIDCNVTFNGYALAVECKKPSGDQPTPRQRETLKKKWLAGACCLVVYSVDHFVLLRSVLLALESGDHVDARALCIPNLREHGVEI